MEQPVEHQSNKSGDKLLDPTSTLGKDFPPRDEKEEERLLNTSRERLSFDSLTGPASKQSKSSLHSLRNRRHRHGHKDYGTYHYGREYGNWPHLKKKDTRYLYEERTRQYDPFFQVDVATDCETYFVGQKARTLIRETQHFAYIVDLDNYEYHKVVFHSFLNDILQSPFFRHGILFLVLVNAVLIGLATIPSLKHAYFLFEVLDMVILSVFIFEVMIKWIYDFRLFWATSWNMLDFAIISLTMLAAVIPLGANGDVAVILVKVVRAFRSLRCVSSMTSLRIVSHTVIKSGLDMGNILLVLLIIMLVLSVMAVILFDIEDLTPQRFLNALDAWIVLFICVTQDGWAVVLNSYDRQSRYFVIISIYLIFSVSLGAFVFANLIVAVIVANLELSVKEMRGERNENPHDFNSTFEGVAEIDIAPVYDLLSKNSFVCISQRPLRVPKLKRLSKRKLQVYTSLIVALEQNMLEADIIYLDLEKIMAVLLSIAAQLDANTNETSNVERENALNTLAKIIETMSRTQIKSKLRRHSIARSELIAQLEKRRASANTDDHDHHHHHHHVQFSGTVQEKVI